jgi:hypothetical protein
MSSYVPNITGGGSGGGNVNVVTDASAAGLEVRALAGGAVTGVTDGTLTTIVTFTASAPKTLISSVTVSGTLYAKFDLFLNAVLLETRRSGPERTLTFAFTHPLKIVATDILDVKVEHYNVGQVADFESTVYGG